MRRYRKDTKIQVAFYCHKHIFNDKKLSLRIKKAFTENGNDSNVCSGKNDAHNKNAEEKQNY